MLKVLSWTFAGRLLLFGIPIFQFAAFAQERVEPRRERAPETTNETVILPEFVPDPLEPVNRAFWGLNRVLLTGVVRPTAKVYRGVVAKPVRTGIANFGRNITYPSRLVNTLLQARWTGAWDETVRFGCNSILGLGGFFDVASHWGIPKTDADFGQTFGKWGWQPDFYLMLPLFGPSSDRDTLGLAADAAANPLSYLSPYPKVFGQPETYLSPYGYASAVVTYNGLAESAEPYARFTKTEMDPYSELQYAWNAARDTAPADFTPQAPPDEASLETMQSLTVTVGDPEFPNRARTDGAYIPTTGKKLPFTYWLQTGTAPIVFILPGIGSHRLAGGALALAQLVVDNGFSAVCVSNPFNYEFAERASTSAVPGYTPSDAEDLRTALAAVLQKLERKHPARIGAKALVGYSLGGFEALFLAATEKESQLVFDRYVGIDAPAHLLYGMAKLDEFYQAPLAWPADTREEKIKNTFRKLAVVMQGSSSPRPGVPPFSGIESKFLVGAAFRLILRDTIYTSQSRHDFGILQHRIDPLRRRPVYREILQFSFQEYFAQFVTPYYASRGVDLAGPEYRGKATDLHAYQDQLARHPNVRLIENRNDFLLGPGDLEWLGTTIGTEHLIVFPHGGHLGNMGSAEVQNAILKALTGLGSLRPEFEKKL